MGMRHTPLQMTTKKGIDSILAIQNLDTIDQGLHQIILKELDKIQFNAPNTKLGGSPEHKLAAAPDGSGTAECGSDLGSSQERGFSFALIWVSVTPQGRVMAGMMAQYTFAPIVICHLLNR